MYIKDVVEAVAEELPSASILVPGFNSNLFSNVDIRTLVEHLTFMIGDVLQERIRAKGKEAAYTEVILIGHSIGALTVRGAYLASRGKKLFNGDNPQTDRKWPVTRIIMLAGINAGWHAPTRKRVGWRRSFVFRLMIMKAGWNNTAKFMLSTNADSTFITDLRCRWLDLVAAQQNNNQVLPIVVQIQGDLDGLITESDTHDFWGSRTFHRSKVPDTEHFNVGIFKTETGREIGENEKKKPGNVLFHWFTKEHVRTQEVHDNRRRVFVDALKAGTPPSDPPPDDIDRSTRDVVWLLHGIRDLGHWAAELKLHIEAHSPGVKASSTGYRLVSLLGFVAPIIRRWKLRSFIEAYTTLRVTYPLATVHFCGHSFGTYLFCKALSQQVSFCFGNVVFAGSVVYRDFDWDLYFAEERVRGLLTFIGSRDWVVALLPGYFEKMPLKPDSRFRDLLGGAGFEGFIRGAQRQQYIVKGGHSAAIRERNFDSLSSFLVHRKLWEPWKRTDKASGFLGALSAINVVLLPAIVFALVFLGVKVWSLGVWFGAVYWAVIIFVFVWF
jgi:hypothetical protein